MTPVIPTSRLDRLLYPPQERIARRYERHVQSLVHVPVLLPLVIRVGVDVDRAVTVDAATDEVCEALVGNRQAAQQQTFGGKQAHRDEPVVDAPIGPLHTVERASGSRAKGAYGCPKLQALRTGLHPLPIPRHK